MVNIAIAGKRLSCAWMLRRFAIVAAVLACSLTMQAGKKQGLSLAKLPTATVEIKSLAIPVAKQKCPNWAWAAAVEMMLARQGVDIKQTDWILKANGGELCIETTPVLEDIKRAVQGNYVQPDGSKIHIAGIVTKGAPDVGYLVGSLRDERPLLILYGGRVLVLQSVLYDEYIYPNNQRMFEVVKLTLLDPLGGPPVIFDKATDDPALVEGIFEVRVGPIEPFQ
jgi:hypothetical protein